MKDEILLEMMASIMQEMYDEGHGSEFRPAMQNVLVAFNNRGLTPRAADGANCPPNSKVSRHAPPLTQTVGRSLQGAKVMKYLERMLQEGWQVSITLADDGCFYIDVVKESMQRMGFSKESLSKALEELLETMKGDGVI